MQYSPKGSVWFSKVISSSAFLTKHIAFIINNTLIIISIIVFCFCSSNKDEDYWIRECDSTGIKCRYIDKLGKIKIPYGKYYHCYTDTFKNIAFVNVKKGIIAINRKEKILFDVYIYDNGPDYIVDGTFRIINNGKMGFADTLGNVIVSTIYDFVYPFQKGLALVNIGGHSESIDPTDPNCEYHRWVSGNWGIINKRGKIVKEIKYDHKWQNGKDILFKGFDTLEFENGMITKR